MHTLYLVRCCSTVNACCYACNNMCSCFAGRAGASSGGPAQQAQQGSPAAAIEPRSPQKAAVHDADHGVHSQPASMAGTESDVPNAASPAVGHPPQAQPDRSHRPASSAQQSGAAAGAEAVVPQASAAHASTPAQTQPETRLQANDAAPQQQRAQMVDHETQVSPMPSCLRNDSASADAQARVQQDASQQQLQQSNPTLPAPQLRDRYASAASLASSSAYSTADGGSGRAASSPPTTHRAAAAHSQAPGSVHAASSSHRYSAHGSAQPQRTAQLLDVPLAAAAHLAAQTAPAAMPAPAAALPPPPHLQGQPHMRASSAAATLAATLKRWSDAGQGTAAAAASPAAELAALRASHEAAACAGDDGVTHADWHHANGAPQYAGLAQAGTADTSREASWRQSFSADGGAENRGAAALNHTDPHATCTQGHQHTLGGQQAVHAAQQTVHNGNEALAPWVHRLSVSARALREHTARVLHAHSAIGHGPLLSEQNSVQCGPASTPVHAVPNGHAGRHLSHLGTGQSSSHSSSATPYRAQRDGASVLSAAQSATLAAISGVRYAQPACTAPANGSYPGRQTGYHAASSRRSTSASQQVPASRAQSVHHEHAQSSGAAWLPREQRLPLTDLLRTSEAHRQRSQQQEQRVQHHAAQALQRQNRH